MGKSIGPAVMPSGRVQVILGGLAGVAGVDPVDMPVLFEGEDEADLKGAAGGDTRGERDEFGGEMLGFDGAGAAVADDLKLGVRGCEKQGGAGEEQEGGEFAYVIHSVPIVGVRRWSVVIWVSGGGVRP
ncbi:hypothetical protein RBB78_19695 [Tunturiibacter empetritectus]|uniref:hypothetical protein n=1 Tax=Tunturiibacter empetritectus TaxID=3069691 RepID=UPI003D9BC26E